MKALLLDRDGVLTEERADYLYTPENLKILAGVLEGLSLLKDTYKFFVVSNQSGVARGWFTMETVEACNEKLREILRTRGIELEAIQFCPHAPEADCACRKPKTGMWDALRAQHDLRPEDCIMVGNRSTDIQFGRNVGCFTVQVEDPHGIEELPDLIVPSLVELAAFLQSHPNPSRIVLSLEHAAEFAAAQKKLGKKIVTTNGTFDLLHPGHRYLLSEARKHGDILIVGVNSDASVKRYKGADRPIEPEDIRARKVAALADAVFIFDDDDPRPWLPKIKPDVHVNAATYGPECIEAPVVRELGAELVLVDLQPQLGSTSDILRSKGA